MKFKDMQEDVVYEVTKGSSDGSVRQGDVIALLSSDKSLLMMQKNDTLGWMTPDDYNKTPECTDFECKVSQIYYIHCTAHDVKVDYIPSLTAEYPWNRQLEAVNGSKHEEVE